MSLWTDLATWVGPISNVGGRMTEHRGVVLHIAEGTYDGTIAWARNITSNVSYHFVSAKDGRAAQLVDTDITAWTQASGNGRWISIEFEGHSGDSLTAEQLRFAALILARCNRQYGVPIQSTDDPAGRGLGWHGMGGSSWGGHTTCPGAPIVAQRAEILRMANQILGVGDMNLDDPIDIPNWDNDPERPSVEHSTVRTALAVAQQRPYQALREAQRLTKALAAQTVEMRSAFAQLSAEIAKVSAAVTSLSALKLSDEQVRVVAEQVTAGVASHPDLVLTTEEMADGLRTAIRSLVNQK